MLPSGPTECRCSGNKSPHNGLNRDKTNLTLSTGQGKGSTGKGFLRGRQERGVSRDVRTSLGCSLVEEQGSRLLEFVWAGLPHGGVP